MTKVVFLTTITSELNYPKFSQNLIYPSEFLCDLLYEICPIDGYIKTRFKIIRIINFIQLILHHNHKMSLK
jgi:hypothetical protein